PGALCLGGGHGVRPAGTGSAPAGPGPRRRPGAAPLGLERLGRRHGYLATEPVGAVEPGPRRRGRPALGGTASGLGLREPVPAAGGPAATGDSARQHGTGPAQRGLALLGGGERPAVVRAMALAPAGPGRQGTAVAALAHGPLERVARVLARGHARP